ncbi:hypothetical protein ACLOJK_028756 [Asimina triloba]
MKPNKELELMTRAKRESNPRRLAAGTATEGAMVAGCRHREGTRPATGSHNLQAV